MYGKNIWVSDAVYVRLQKMKTTIVREWANDPDIDFVKVPPFNDVISLALAALEDHYDAIERKSH